MSRRTLHRFFPAGGWSLRTQGVVTRFAPKVFASLPQAPVPEILPASSGPYYTAIGGTINIIIGRPVGVAGSVVWYRLIAVSGFGWTSFSGPGAQTSFNATWQGTAVPGGVPPIQVEAYTVLPLSSPSPVVTTVYTHQYS